MVSLSKQGLKRVPKAQSSVNFGIAKIYIKDHKVLISQYVAIGVKTNKIRSQILETHLIMGKIKVKLCKYKPKIQPKAVFEKYLFVSSVPTGRKQRIKTNFLFLLDHL